MNSDELRELADALDPDVDLMLSGADRKVAADFLRECADSKPIARLLHWHGPAPHPQSRVAARTFDEFSAAEADSPNSYWSNGEPLYTRPQPAQPTAGWQLVPVKELDDLIREARFLCEYGGGDVHQRDRLRRAGKAFDAALAAAPTPPAQADVREPTEAQNTPAPFIRLYDHAYGMSLGVDWNKGTHAAAHRAPLLDAVSECKRWLDSAPQPVSEPMDAEAWAELHRLRAEAKGPDGYATWKEAAVSERIRRVRAEKHLTERQPVSEPTEAQIEAGARELCHRFAELCNVNEQDTWNAHCGGFRDDAAEVLRAALAAKEQPK